MARLASDTTPVHTHTPDIEPYVYCEAYQSVSIGKDEVDEFHANNHSPYYDDMVQGHVDIAHPDFSSDALLDYYLTMGSKTPKPAFIVEKPV